MDTEPLLEGNVKKSTRKFLLLFIFSIAGLIGALRAWETEPTEKNAESTAVGMGALPSTLMMVAGNPKMRPRPPRCGDPVAGFEAKGNFCSQYSTHAFLSMTSRIAIPKVLDAYGRCQDLGGCSKKDAAVCCRERNQCLHYPRDVGQGCPQNTLANPFKYAFCRTYPCTAEDQDICCLEVEERYGLLYFKDLYERIAKSQSKPSRIHPDRESAYTKPAITFSEGDLVWFAEGQARNFEMEGTSATDKILDRWRQLVPFMDSWGMGEPWARSGAWMKVFDNELVGKAAGVQIAGEKYLQAFWDPAINQLGTYQGQPVTHQLQQQEVH